MKAVKGGWLVNGWVFRGMDISKAVFLCVSGLLVVGTTFGAGVYSAASRNAVFVGIQDGVSMLSEALNAVKETPVLEPTPFLQPARRPGEGVTVNQVGDDGALILIAGFFEGNNQLRLIRRDGSVVARWPVRFSELFPDPDHIPEGSRPATDWNIETHGALALRDGSVLFNFEYGGLVKLDRCGRVVWTLAHPTHHSIERAEGGGFWVPGRRHVRSDTDRLTPFEPPYDEDLVLHVSADGEVLSEFSVPQLMFDNGMEPILTANGFYYGLKADWDQEIVHLNKVAELSAELATAFSAFEAGDLALSLRLYNLILIVDPETRQVKWHQTGPWRRQHDPQFNADGTITVFNNNVYPKPVASADDAEAYRSNILRIDPASREVEIAFGARAGQEMLTVHRGKHEVLEGGGFLITEAEGGRVIETDGSGAIVWEYSNRYDAENIAEITGARLYPEGYFGVEDWTCDIARN